jgi:hypothetical protein
MKQTADISGSEQGGGGVMAVMRSDVHILQFSTALYSYWDLYQLYTECSVLI